MSSLNINTISNEPHFKNYFSDPLTFPKNAMISLPKSNLQVPVLVAARVQVPFVDDTNDICLMVTIDGITEPLSWADIYDAHVSFVGVNAAPTGTINTAPDYSGASIDLLEAGDIGNYCGVGFGDDGNGFNYCFYPNNTTMFTGNTMYNGGVVINTTKTKISFGAVLAKAISDKFKFYNVTTSNRYKGGYDFDNDFFGDQIVSPLKVGGIGANINHRVTIASNNQLTHFGFDVTYDPGKMTRNGISYINFNNAGTDLVGWTPGPVDNHRLTAPAIALPTIAVAFSDARAITIDPNGGWVMGIPNLQSAGNMAFGLNLVAAGRNNGYLAASTTKTNISDVLGLIDIGFVFSQDATGNNRWSVVDRGIVYPSGETTIAPGDPLAGPPIFTNNADHFYIHISRGNLFNGTSRFIFSLFCGSGPLDTPPGGDELVYTTTVADDNATFSGGDLNPVLCILNDAAAVSNTIHQVSYIAKSTQSVEQGNYLETIDGRSLINSISLEPIIVAQDNDLFNGSIDQQFSFWASWGLNCAFNSLPSWQLEHPVRTQKIVSFEGSNLQRHWEVEADLSNSDLRYYLGVNRITEIFEKGDGTSADFLILKTSKQLRELPQLLQVSCSNIDVKNFNGNYISAGSSGVSVPSGVLESSSTNRVIGTIPIDTSLVGTGSTNIVLNYEPFNLIYRPINNPRSFSINYLDIDIFFRDFLDGQRKTIGRVKGTIDLDIHVKTGPTPPKVDEDTLRPF
tara:strand:+ start:3878 stop:6091 length:2214 start_codon:yes stop_codon:yes gene_type:complete